MRAGFDDGRGRVEVEVTADAAAFPVTLRLPELGVERVWSTAADVAAFDIDGVEPWSAEQPRLYDATVSSATETVSLRVGFRTVEIRGDRFLVNGRRVVFHGMNRHEAHPERGRVFDEEHARADLARMKRFNVNAIRTSHYPPHPRLLDLADELGFWVVLECDSRRTASTSSTGSAIERRPGMARGVSRPYPADRRTGQEPPQCRDLVARQRGGNRQQSGRHVGVGPRPGRRTPVHYEGDHAGEYTDVYSRMYASVLETEQIGTDGSRAPLMNCTPAQGARQRTKPFLLCEYAHAMGNGPGALDRYEDRSTGIPGCTAASSGSGAITAS